LYSSSDIIWLIKSRRRRWAGHVACIGRREVQAGFLWENMMGTDHLENLGIDRRKILKGMSKT